MTFNAEFLWDGVDPEEGARDVTFPWKGRPAEARDHMRAVADIVIQENPDIVNLVEVENLSAITSFNNEFLATRGYKPYLIEGRDTHTGQDVALLTRIDPEDTLIRRDERKGVSGAVEKSVSKHYIARINAGDLKISFIGLHLLAIPNHTGRQFERQAQADAIRSMAVEEQRAGRLLVIWGDFNDYDGADEARDHVNSTPITDVLARIRAMSSDDPMDDLVNVAAFVPKPMRYTAHYDEDRDGQVDAPRELTSIDHILVSPSLASRIESVQMRHEHDPLRVSDHFPIMAEFRLTDVGPPAPTPPSTPPATVRIIALVPNPSGDEEQNERVLLRNLSPAPVRLEGWTLTDESGAKWSLSGSLAGGQTREVRRAGQAMAMNNHGDTILLFCGGQLVQTVQYGRVGEEETVTPGS
ncbi:MAG: lamin tail domain-containing protein [Phycisphaerales bacterium]|nr:lamin tail domain-containing protein [Phycisphaerales bacterium]